MTDIKKVGNAKGNVIAEGIAESNNTQAKYLPCILAETKNNVKLNINTASGSSNISSVLFTGYYDADIKYIKYNQEYSKFSYGNIVARFPRGNIDSGTQQLSINDKFLGKALLDSTGYELGDLPYNDWGNNYITYLNIDAAIFAEKLQVRDSFLAKSDTFSGENNFSSVQYTEIKFPENVDVRPSRIYGWAEFEGISFMPEIVVDNNPKNQYDIARMQYDPIKGKFVGVLTYSVNTSARDLYYRIGVDGRPVFDRQEIFRNTYLMTVYFESDLYYPTRELSYYQLNGCIENSNIVAAAKNPDGYEYGVTYLASARLVETTPVNLYELSIVEPTYNAQWIDDEYNTVNQLVTTRIVDGEGTIYAEVQRMSQSKLFPEFEDYYLIYQYELNKALGTILKLASIVTDCFGSSLINNKLTVPAINLIGINNSLPNFNLINISGINPDIYSFIFNNYCYLVDAVNEKIYITRRDGTGYFTFDVSEFTDDGTDFAYFAVLDDHTMRLGYWDDERVLISYKDIEFNLFLMDIKPLKIAYDFKKINVSFLPCQTHCMAKGGIISKV